MENFLFLSPFPRGKMKKDMKKIKPLFIELNRNRKKRGSITLRGANLCPVPGKGEMPETERIGIQFRRKAQPTGRGSFSTRDWVRAPFQASLNFFWCFRGRFSNSLNLLQYYSRILIAILFFACPKVMKFSLFLVELISPPRSYGFMSPKRKNVHLTVRKISLETSDGVWRIWNMMGICPLFTYRFPYLNVWEPFRGLLLSVDSRTSDHSTFILRKYVAIKSKAEHLIDALLYPAEGWLFDRIPS